MARQFADLMLGSIEIFCLTAELQSFTAAAASAGLTPAAVSKSVSRLESRLGVRLFVRTTRRVRLTENGRTYFERCRQAMGQLIDAEREVTGAQVAPSGAVRISLPTPYGHYRVLPLVPEFHREFPQVELEIQLSNRNVDFTSEGFDLAVRSRNPPDSGLVARKIEDAELMIVAAPKYLRRRGTPNSIESLHEHECIQFVLPSTGQVVPWLLRKQGREVELATQGNVRCLDDFLGPVTLARAGAGLLQTYRFIVEEDLRRGTLQEVLPSLKGASRPFSLLFPSNRHVPQRVRVLIDFLMHHLGGAPKRSRR